MEKVKFDSKEVLKKYIDEEMLEEIDGGSHAEYPDYSADYDLHSLRKVWTQENEEAKQKNTELQTQIWKTRNHETEFQEVKI